MPKFSSLKTFMLLCFALILSGCPLVRATGDSVKATGEGIGHAVVGTGQAIGQAGHEMAP